MTTTRKTYTIKCRRGYAEIDQSENGFYMVNWYENLKGENGTYQHFISGATRPTSKACYEYLLEVGGL